MAETSRSNNKRCRGEYEDFQEEKRLRADLLLDILEDIDSVDRNPATGDLATVMKSFEEEIALLRPKEEEDIPVPVTSTSGSDDLTQLELGYLLEASDDELGLPPTVPTSSDEVDAAEELGSGDETGGFGQIWGFDDEIPICYEPLDFGLGDEKEGGEDDVFFDGGLFDYPGVVSPSSDFSDYSWQQAESSLPAFQ